MEIRKQVVIFSAGAAMAFAFPPFAGGFLAYAGLAPLLYWLRDSDAPNAARTGFFWGLGFNAAALYWICYSTILGGIASIILLALFSMVVPVVYSLGYRFWRERFVWCFPFLWTGWEYIRSFGDIGFPWVIMGNTQTYYTNSIQYISYTGIYGASALVCLVNVFFYKFFGSASLREMLRWSVAILIALLIPYLHGIWVKKSYVESDDALRISLIQGNIDPWAKWDKEFKDYNFQVYEDLSRQAAGDVPDLIIWPESAATAYIRHDSRYLAWIHKVCDELEIPVFTGALDAEFEEERRIFNAAVLFEPHSEALQRYAKMQLVPISERFPYVEFIPERLRFDFGQGPSDFSKGNEIKLFSFLKKKRGNTIQSGNNTAVSDTETGKNRVNFAAVICYESIFSSLVREFCALPADLLVIITNDAWFGRSSGTYQHAQYAVLRAIEHRIPVARCANTGISMFINPLGDIIYRTSLEEAATATHSIRLRAESTFFTRYGDWFPRLLTLGALFIAIVTLVKAAALSFAGRRE